MNILPKNSISRRFSYALIIVFTTIMLFFSITFLFYYTSRLDNKLKILISSASTLAERTLPNALWDIDNEYINDFVDSLFLYEEIVYVRVTSEGNTFFDSSNIIKIKTHPDYSQKGLSFFEKSTQFLVSKTDIQHEKETIGNIEIVVSRKTIRTAVISAITWISFFIIIIISATVLTIIAFSKRYIFQPLEKLGNSAKSISDGNLDTIVDLTSTDEIGQLAQNFDSMRKAVKNSIEKIRRTDELAEINKELQKEIEDRSRAEKKLQSSKELHRGFLNNLNAGVVAHAPDTTVIYYNQKALQLLGLSKEQMIGKTAIDPHWKFLNADGTEMLFEDFPINRALKNKTEIKDYIVGLLRPNINYVTWVACNSFSVINDDELEYILISFFDITKRKLAEERKIELEAQLRQSHKMEAIGTMAGGIAHDFNNILAAILGYADLAKEDLPNNNPAKDLIEEVLIAGNRAKDLVRHILTFSRMSNLEQSYVQINLSSIVKEVIKFQRSIIPTTISIKSNIDESCGQIKGDPTQIHQVIMNFCTNASHAMENEGGTLKVKISQIELSLNDLKIAPDLQVGTYIKLSVSDTGTGMIPKLVDNIFDPYFTTKKIGKGSGMGLAVVRGIVKQHGGFIKVESELGKGSTFNAFFPLIEKKISAENTEEAEALPVGTENILYIDDEKMLVDIGKSTLEKLGYFVTPLTNSSKALELFHSDPTQFDLVITDQTMPNLSGSELAKQLLIIRPDIPIILCTGYSNMIDNVKSQKIGIKEYAMKPVDKTVLVKLVRKVLDSK